MRKWWKLGALTVVFSVALSFSAFAGEWKQDATGYWWQEDDGSFPKSQWKWLDGNGDGVSECYYFNENGYMARSSIIDGRQVDKNGAWIENGTVQTQRSWALVKDSNDPLALLAAATEAGNELQSVDMNFVMNMQMSAGGETMDTNTSGRIQMKNAQSPDKMQYITDMNMDMLGTTVKTTAFYQDGWYYMDMNGQKLKMEMPYQQALEAAQSSTKLTNLSSADSSLAYISDASMVRNGSEVTVYYTADAKKLMDEVNAVYKAMGISLSDLGMNMDITQYKGECTIDENGLARNQRMLFDINLGTGEDTMQLHIYMEANIQAAGDAVQFTLPSTDGYQDLYAGA